MTGDRTTGQLKTLLKRGFGRLLVGRGMSGPAEATSHSPYGVRLLELSAP